MSRRCLKNPSWQDQPRPDSDFVDQPRPDSNFGQVPHGNVEYTIWDDGNTLWDLEEVQQTIQQALEGTLWDFFTRELWDRQCYG